MTIYHCCCCCCCCYHCYECCNCSNEHFHGVIFYVLPVRLMRARSFHRCHPLHWRRRLHDVSPISWVIILLIIPVLVLLLCCCAASVNTTGTTVLLLSEHFKAPVGRGCLYYRYLYIIYIPVQPTSNIEHRTSEMGAWRRSFSWPTASGSHFLRSDILVGRWALGIVSSVTLHTGPASIHIHRTAHRTTNHNATINNC